MEALTPSDYDIHIRNLLETLSSSSKAIQDIIESAINPMKSTNVYYPQRNLSSPNVSHLPLPPNLSLPVIFRLFTSPNTRSIGSTPKTTAMAFEISTPAALIQSLHYYFPEHISTNLYKGLYPSFTEVTIITAPSSDGTAPTVPIHNRDVFSLTGLGAEIYVQRVIKEASAGRLCGIAVHVAWKSSAQEAAEGPDGGYAISARPRHRFGYRRTAPALGRGMTFDDVFGGIPAVHDAAADAPTFQLTVDHRLEGDTNEREETLENMIEHLSGPGATVLRPAFRQLLEATGPLGVGEVMGPGFAGFLNIAVGGMMPMPGEDTTGTGPGW